MRPTQTTFKLVQPGGAFNKLYALAKRVGQPLTAGTLNFPTVAAERDGKVIGFVSTLPVAGAVVAGPLVIEKAPNMFLFLRLAEAYEVVLRAAKVSTYFFAIEKGRDSYVAQMERLGFVKCEQNDDQIVMRRNLT